MVAERHRLRRLEMGEARHHGGGMLTGAIEQRLDQEGEPGLRPLNSLLDPEPKVERHLVVARAGRVKPASRRADQLGQPRLDVHVNVLEAGREFERALLDL